MLKFKELDDKKKKMIILVTTLILFIGVSFAFIAAQLSGGIIGNANVTADTTDNLEFSVDKDIYLNPTQFNVVEGGGGLSDTAVGTASLIANSTNNEASATYNVYFKINTNEYIYTTEDSKPEIVLTITDPNGTPITSVDGLTYVTAENADGTTVSGFDITTEMGLFTIASNYGITSSSSTVATEQEWTFTVTFINLTTNQTENGGSTLDAEIILGIEERYTLANYIIENVYVEDGINNLYYHDGNVETQIGLCTYQGETVYNIWLGDSSSFKSDCQNVFSLTLNDGSIVYYDEYIKLDSFPNKYGMHYNNNNIVFQNVIWDSDLSKCVTSTTNDDVYTLEGDLAEEQVCDGTAAWYNGRLTLMESVGAGDFEITETVSLIDANDKSYRYSGMYPNNYVCFGSLENDCSDEYLYRIIGIFDEDNDGTYSVKLIKSDYTTSNMLGTDGRDYLGNNYTDQYTSFYGGSLDLNLIPTFNWNSDTSISEYGSNNWATSELNTINLNVNFLNYLGTTWNNLIDNTTWFLGGLSLNDFNNYNIKNIYDAERNNSGYGSNPTRYNAKIGLMYASDYLFSVEPFFWQYAPEVSAFSSWLQTGLDEWVLSTDQDYSFYSFFIMYNGPLYLAPAANYSTQLGIYNSVRPVFYLKSNVTYISGDGSLENPYRVA